MSKERPAFAAQWIGIGVALGAGLGVAFGNIAIGAGSRCRAWYGAGRRARPEEVSLIG